MSPSLPQAVPLSSALPRPEPRRPGLAGRFVSYGLYPLLLAATAGLYALSRSRGWDLARVFMGLAGVRLLLLLTVEAGFPARPEWRMNWSNFRRDLKYMAVNGATGALTKLLPAGLAIELSRWNTGLFAGLPMPLELIGLVLVFELFQYGFHRFSHEGRGRLGAWFWKVHAAHHLPDRVYLLMHPVGHPINALISLALMQLPLVLLGVRQETLFLFNALMGLQGLVSHFNVDLRAGPLNYLLVGTELHRNHHSADRHEAGNYGVLTPFWDLVFGSFVYRPGRLPAALGVAEPERYPPSQALGRVLLMPFR
jgi:sterol desaturase/sphingolipid hydroxylase (fatty acid hydroxylase superfamily)